MEKIKVPKAVRIPDTDIILEKGDLIGIVRAKKNSKEQKDKKAK